MKKNVQESGARICVAKEKNHKFHRSLSFSICIGRFLCDHMRVIQIRKCFTFDQVDCIWHSTLNSTTDSVTSHHVSRLLRVIHSVPFPAPDDVMTSALGFIYMDPLTNI